MTRRTAAMTLAGRLFIKVTDRFSTRYVVGGRQGGRHMNQNVLKKISDRTTSERDLKSEISKLGGVTEPPSFWIDIANDQTYSAGHRATCICQLFKRHVKGSISLVDLTRLLDHPDWINPDTVTTVRYLRGEIPVAWNLGETVFAIRLFLRELEEPPVLYLRLSQSIEAETFVQIVTASRHDATAAGISVLQAACSV